MCLTNVGACGLDCSSCGANIAYLANDDELRKQVAKEWSEKFQVNITPDQINCTGCMKEGAKIGHCAECDMRNCVIERKLNHCGECEDFACSIFEEFVKWVPDAKERILALRTT